MLRQQPAENGAIGLVNVADEFFVALRVRGDEVRMMLSDVTAAVAWDLARQVIDRLGIDAPDDERVEDVWPAGDVGIFADLGLDEMELGALLADLDAYADEMLTQRRRPARVRRRLRPRIGGSADENTDSMLLPAAFDT